MSLDRKRRTRDRKDSNLSRAFSNASAGLPPLSPLFMAPLLPKKDPKVLAKPPNLILNANNLPNNPSKNSGNCNIRNVCPVGAVSIITTSYLPFFKSSPSSSNNCDNATISSKPGGGFLNTDVNSSNPKDFKKETSKPVADANADGSKVDNVSRNSDKAAVASTSNANKLPLVKGSVKRTTFGPPLLLLLLLSKEVRSTSRASPNE